jgi:hypothetical protein
MNYRYLVLITLLAANVTRASTDDIVKRFFPAELKVRDGAPIRAQELQRVALSGDLDHSGTSLIVALYTNDDQGALAVLSPQGEGAMVALDDDGLPGGTPALALLDIDGDGRKEILATIDDHEHGTTTWVYAWQGTTLARLHRAGSADPLDDAIIDPTFIDLNGDGVLEVIEHTASRETDAQGEQRWVAGYEVLTFSKGGLQHASAATLLATFLRGKGTPRPVVRSFTVDDVGTYRLVVINGAMSGAARVASAIIKLNGTSTLAERDFNEAVARREVPVTLAKGANDLSVEVRGAPGSQLTILVLPK